MPRQTVSDITPRRTVRDIPVPNHRKPTRVKVDDVSAPPPLSREPKSRRIEVNHEVPPPPPPPSNDDMRRDPSYGGRRPSFGRLKLLIVGALVLGLTALLGSYVLRVQATVTVTEKTKPASIDGTFIGKQEAKENELPFQIITATKEDSKTVAATGEKNVETRASGTIIVYNNYSSSPQRLIKNTRFETANGRIYRIDQSIVVPGKKADSTPGSVEAVVFADAAGPDYNIGLSDFTIPGFKSDARYSKFYARSKTPMTGGFIGKIKTASASDLKSANETLKSGLTQALKDAISKQVPGSAVLFNTGTYVDFETLSAPDSNEVRIKATAYGVVFDRKKISSHIAKATIGEYNNEEVIADNLDFLIFTPIPADAKPWQTGAISFSLKGTTTVTWLFDQEKLKGDLAGQPKQKARITEILKAYPGIAEAQVTVRPFWQSTLPENPKSIEVSIDKHK